MDVFSHALWTNLFYYPFRVKLGDRLWAVFFGVLPDLVSFVPSTLFLLFSRTSFPMTVEDIPDIWVFRYALESYNFTHSIFLFALLFLLVTVLRKGKLYWPLLGWALHIFLDVFTHKSDFFPTPLFFPATNFKFMHGFSWAEVNFLLVNWLVLILLYIVLSFEWRLKRKGVGRVE